MANQPPGNRNQLSSAADDDILKLRTLLIKYMGHWKLFLACVLAALAVAFIYYKYAKPVYQVTATLVIQDSNDKPTPENSPLVVFQELDNVNAPKVVENEIEVLRSRKLIKEVVDNFQLWVDYRLKDGISYEDLYGISPVKFDLFSSIGPVSTQKLAFTVLDTATYMLGDDSSEVNRHHFGDTVTNNWGTWRIMRSAAIRQYIGKTIQIVSNDPETTILTYQNALNIDVKEKPATVVNLTINDQDIKRGEDFINYLIYFYKLDEADEKHKVITSTLAIIDKRIDSLSKQLNKTENNIAGYRSGEGLADISSQSQIDLQAAQANNDKLNEINIQLNSIGRLEDYVNSPDNSNGNIPSVAGINDAPLTGMVQKLSDIQLEKSKLLATLPEKNPAFEPINNQIATLKTAIKEDINNIEGSLLATQKTLEFYRSEYQSSIKSVPVQQQQLAGLDRQQSSKQNLYDYLLQKREEISLSDAASSPDVHLVDAAYLLPIKASKKLIPFGAAFLLGLIFPAGFIYSKDLIKHSISSRKEIEEATGVPVIAEFSDIALASAIVVDNKDNPDAFILIEQFRNLRSQVNLLSPPVKGGNLTMITSSQANEGKSFISSNLAVSLTKTGKKTILIETDIYKPKISKRFNLQGSAGLTDYLQGRKAKADIIQQAWSYPDLHIIGSGPFIDNFPELLELERFKKLCDELRLEYDHILFDTPPIHAINDAYMIAKFCDLTLYVVRFNYTSKSLLPFIEKLNTDEKLPNMNIVFNGLTDGRDGNGFKYENYYRGK